MPTPRMVAIVLVLAVLAGCQATVDAKYPGTLTACDLLPRDQAIQVTDVGAKLSTAQAKESHVLVPYKYCLWSYKQPRAHWYSAYAQGPIERQLKIYVSVHTAKQHGAKGAIAEYDGQRSSMVANHATVGDVPGIGEQAFLATDDFQGLVTSRVWFRRSNAVVEVELWGTDCCASKTQQTQMQAANRRRLLLAAATAADRNLPGR
ncbi:hypothetical protein ACFV9C_04390 [Kribbella sp. NPDC059898]|uniref:hypothetical protein n=1 Tax=Kribbella sp. NPDC059898 TaxID=3346995 RepID=UPI0036603D11